MLLLADSLTFEGLNLYALSFRHLLSRGPVKGRWTELGILSLRFGVVLVPITAVVSGGET